MYDVVRSVVSSPVAFSCFVLRSKDSCLDYFDRTVYFPLKTRVLPSEVLFSSSGLLKRNKRSSGITRDLKFSFKPNVCLVSDMDARPWDFQAEECALRACVDRFNNRRYGSNGVDPEFQPVDNCLQSVLGQKVELSEEFMENYERWLEVEVFSNQIDWDQVLTG